MDFNTGNALTIVILIAYAAIFVFYLFAEKENSGKEGFKRATAVKLALSGLFCLVGVISYYLLLNFSHHNNFYLAMQLLVVIGLFTALCGDFFLQYIRLDVTKYMTGIGFFMTTQILFLVSMSILNGFTWQEFVITAVALVLVLLLMKKQDWKLGKEQKIVTVYTVLLTLMASKSVMVFWRDLSGNTLLFMIGALLFLLSDVVLGIWNYHTGKRAHANLNWVFYFSGMMLIALSISPKFQVALGYWV